MSRWTVKHFLTILLLNVCILLHAGHGWADALDFLVIQPGQPGTPEEAQPVMNALAEYVQERLAGTVVKGGYVNDLGQALDTMGRTRPKWGIVSLTFYVAHAGQFQMRAMASTRPGGFQKDLLRLLVGKDGPDDWQGLKGDVWGTMLHEADAASCLLFGVRSIRLPFTLKGTSQALRSLRAVTGAKAAGVVLDRLQYEAMKALPLANRVKTIYTSKELPTSPVVWFGPTDPMMERLAGILMAMREDPGAAPLLRLLQTNGFGRPDSELPKLRLVTGNEACSP